MMVVNECGKEKVAVATGTYNQQRDIRGNFISCVTCVRQIRACSSKNTLSFIRKKKELAAGWY
jgi:hypothetical protein